MPPWTPDLLNPIRDLLAVLANLATALGIPAAIVLFMREKRRERRAQEYQTYDALDEQYTRFQHLCLDHPRLDVHEVPLERRKPLSGDEQRQELAAFAILFSIFERAFLMYRDKSFTLKRKQWRGWEEYMRHYMARGSARQAWKTVSATGGGFDADFIHFIEGLLASIDVPEAA
jgi:hypothetical protein